jgi:hypothetical protein
VAREVSREEPLGVIGHGVAIAHGRCPVPLEGSDVDREPVLPGPVVLDRGPRVGPGPVEEHGHPVMEEIEEAHQGAVAVVAQAVPRVLGQVQGEGAVGPEQAEDPLLEPRRPPASLLLERRQRGGSEGERGLLG